MNIFDAMTGMRDRALTNYRKPRRWEINEAGLEALLADDRLSYVDSRLPILERSFFGIPITMMPPGPSAKSSDPRVDLVVDER